MRKVDVQLNDLFDIVEDETVEEVVLSDPPAVVKSDAKNRDDDVDVDYEKSREYYYKLLDKGNDAIDGILALAKEGEHPRAYEVAGQLIKTVADVSKDLLEMQEKLKKLKEVPKTGPKSVTNALFVGSTTELQKLLKDKKQNG